MKIIDILQYIAVIIHLWSQRLPSCGLKRLIWTQRVYIDAEDLDFSLFMHTGGAQRPILGQLRDSQAESRFVASSETKSG